ncbi:MAG: ABC transporter permease subunit, partial [Actinobacteria bacterium]|nr:ABC transporter permease subunit [Actinomycetota bacterium]
LSINGYTPLIENPFKFVQFFILPWITLAIAYAALYTRFTRAAVLETLGEDYIRTARAKGVKERTVLFKHTMRAVFAPIITLAGLDFAGLIGGAIITETIFNLPGLGRLTLRSTFEFDLPVVLATTILAAAVVIIMNLIIDMLYAVLDPRVRI